MKYKEQLYGVFEELIQIKRQQRGMEERLFQVLAKPIHRRWIYERVQEQYKHEKILLEAVRLYLGQDLEIGPIEQTQTFQKSIVQEIQNRLEHTEVNIRLINKVTQSIDDFKMYRMINSILCDEYIYQNKLIRILTDK